MADRLHVADRILDFGRHPRSRSLEAVVKFPRVALRANFSQLIGMAEPVRAFIRWRPQLRDPGDELVLEAAVNGQADAIVTFNESHLREARTNFGIEVLRPGEALRRIEK